MANLTPELEAYRVHICKIAKDQGLDFFETIFEIVSFDELNQIAAYGGFPKRYPHWRFGMQYEKLSKSYTYGLSKIYELVINTDPCVAYLMRGNETLDQKLVMAHVYGHCDFFKNNDWFSKTNRRMIDKMANHSVKVKRFNDLHGQDVVENFIDLCLSVENLIDPYSVFSKNVDNNKISEDNPQRDLLLFLVEKAPLKDWQRDVLNIIRDESYYFAPQGATKIMNEGWASYWHSKIMTEKIVEDRDIIEFADRHSGTMAMAPDGFNPYKIGIELFRDIESRWNKGQFGEEWESCSNMKEKLTWNKNTNLGRKKIFEVRKIHNDFTFIKEFLTEEFCKEHKMFVYQKNPQTGAYEYVPGQFEKVKNQFLNQLTNMGQPVIKLIDPNFEGRGELLLSHIHEGQDLQSNYMGETLKNIQALWGKSVNLLTIMDDEKKIFTHDGVELKSKVV